MRFLVLASIVAGSPALADIAECRKLGADTARLECYDSLARGDDEPSETMQADAQTTDKSTELTEWEVRKGKSPIDDSESITLVSSSNEIVECSYKDAYPAALFARCQENTTAVFVAVNCFMSDHSGYGDVTLRIDEDAPFNEKFYASTDNAALGAWRGRQAIPILKKMANGETLTMRFTPMNESPKTVTFNLQGFKAGAQQLAQTCGWQLN